MADRAPSGRAVDTDSLRGDLHEIARIVGAATKFLADAPIGEADRSKISYQNAETLLGLVTAD